MTRRAEPNVFHRHIIASNAPDWAAVPYTEDLTVVRENYEGTAFWQTVGRPLLDEAIAAGGFWTQLFDPDAAPDQTVVPDLIPIVYLLPLILDDLGG
jgi:hypothetical protein